MGEPVGAGVRIAMWSGPRNISTAMLRSFGARTDAFVTDEPLYAHYLMGHGFDHPGRDEILAHCETDWRVVTRWLSGPIPEGRAVWYQKHMAHHLLPGMWEGEDGRWLDALTHGFLIREPRAMLASLCKVLPDVQLEDTGLPQQWGLFQRMVAQGGPPPPVIDSRTVLQQPAAALRQLCVALGVPFDPAMLAWDPGPRDTDGIWARHWYDSVYQSTGFAPYRPAAVELPTAMGPLLAECQRLYDQLAPYALTVEPEP